jgi:hypothetical protein
MFQGVRIAGLLEDVSGNFIEAEVEAEAVDLVTEEKQETIVTEQESLTIIEPVTEKPKTGKKPKKV